MLKSYSSMTLEEFLKLNSDEIPEFLEIKLDQFICEHEIVCDKLVSVERDLELAHEQVYFARELIENIGGFVRTLSKAKQAEYTKILENSYFET